MRENTDKNNVEYGHFSRSVVQRYGYTDQIKCTIQANIYLFKVNNRNTGKSCEICLKLTIKTPEQQWPCSSVSIFGFKHVFVYWIWLFWHSGENAMKALLTRISCNLQFSKLNPKYSHTAFQSADKYRTLVLFPRKTEKQSFSDILREYEKRPLWIFWDIPK